MAFDTTTFPITIRDMPLGASSPNPKPGRDTADPRYCVGDVPAKMTHMVATTPDGTSGREPHYAVISGAVAQHSRCVLHYTETSRTAWRP